MFDTILAHHSAYKKLFYIEALIPTLCKTNNLAYETPKELETVTFRKKYAVKDMKKDFVYHPVKIMQMHIKARLVI